MKYITILHTTNATNILCVIENPRFINNILFLWWVGAEPY